MEARALQQTTEELEPVVIRSLILENSDEEADSILGHLRAAGFVIEATMVRTLRGYLEAISSHEFAVVFSNSRLGGFTAIDAFHALQKTGKCTAFVLIGEAGDEQFMTECVNQGVDDYVLKNNLPRLPVALKRAMETSKLRQAHDQLRRAPLNMETQNRELIENSAYGIFHADLDGSFLSANPALLQILSCPSLEALQELHLATDVFRFPEHYIKLLASCRENGRVRSAETEWKRKDGGLVAVKLHLRYIRNLGAIDQIEGIVEDVTELRALEQQLLHAQKFEAIGQLAGGIAHDFNNVVGAILGWAELGFEENQALPGVYARFHRIREQASRAANLTRELLAFVQCQGLQTTESRLSCEKQPVDTDSISLTGTETILVAEGHDSIRELLLQSLRGLGYRVLCASNGDEALQLCQQETPAIAILDVFTPHWGGYATASHLRALFPCIPILFASGCSHGCRVANSFFLQKPYGSTALFRLLRRMLDSPCTESPAEDLTVSL